MRNLLGVLILTLLFANEVVSQNYIGYNKQYIKKEMKSRKKEMKGPVTKSDTWVNYIAYFSKDGKRAVYYHLKKQEVKLPDGSTGPTDICYKYISKTKCRSNKECPELDKVINSLNSHFSNEGHYIWKDYSKPIPQEWLIVKEEGSFEVHVSESADAK